MKIVLDIPKEFEGEYNRNHFKESFMRVIADIKYDLHNNDPGLSGNYEIETLEMLMKAFEDSWEIRWKYLSDGIDNAIQLREVEKLTKAIRNEGKLKMGAIYGMAALEGGKDDRSETSNTGSEES